MVGSCLQACSPCLMPVSCSVWPSLPEMVKHCSWWYCCSAAERTGRHLVVTGIRLEGLRLTSPCWSPAYVVYVWNLEWPSPSLLLRHLAQIPQPSLIRLFLASLVAGLSDLYADDRASMLLVQLGVTAVRKDQLRPSCGLKHNKLLVCSVITTRSPFGMDVHGRFTAWGPSAWQISVLCHREQF